MIGAISLFFDTLFIIQHYILYPQARKTQSIWNDKASILNGKANGLDREALKIKYLRKISEGLNNLDTINERS